MPNQPAAPAETKTQLNEPTVFITENKPAVVNAYKQQFPHHKIVMPADDVAKGIDIEDDLLSVPRKAA